MARVRSAAFVLLALAGTARAERYVVARGETLEHVAIAHGCTVDAVLRANHLDTTLVSAGTIIDVPACSIEKRARTRVEPRVRAAADSSDDDKARAALAVVDGAAWIEPPREPRVSAGGGLKPWTTSLEPGRRGDGDGESLGEPWHGALEHAERLAPGAGYVIRRPSRAYGAPHVIDQLRAAIAQVRAAYPDVHTLAIGDLSAEHGGKISEHRSHQSGLDVDVGFYFTRVPAGYPAAFADADSALDLEATWALLVAFANTTSREGGVEMIFLDAAVQKRLYDWARAHGVTDRELAQMFQYPRGRDELAGLVRHWPGHGNHMHVRFKPAR
jgi:murein endopeptidase